MAILSMNFWLTMGYLSEQSLTNLFAWTQMKSQARDSMQLQDTGLFSVRNAGYLNLPKAILTKR